MRQPGPAARMCGLTPLRLQRAASVPPARESRSRRYFQPVLVPQDRHDRRPSDSDAYLVHRYLTDVCHAYPAVRELAGNIDGFETRELVGRMLPAGVATALDRTSERLVLVGASLFTVATSAPQPSGDVPCPAFRLDVLFDRYESSV